MLEVVKSVNGVVNGFIWGIPAMICIIGIGLYLSIGTGFIQIRRFIYAIKHTLGKVFEKKEAESGAMTPFQAVCTALAGTVGTGNIAGVAGAIAIGGPGAVFWMWISALLGMCTKFSEVVLAVHFRERNDKGDWVGGPMYFIKNGLPKKWHFLAVLFSVFGMVAVFGTGNATQVNTIVTAIDSVFTSYNLAEAEGLGMAVFYIILAVGVVIMNIGRVPGVFASIFGGAFDPRAFTGGVVGSMFTSMRRGVSRGIFSNEAGLGTGSIAHASADTGHPVQQGLFGIFEVFTDTIVICTLTSLVILCSGIDIVFGQAAGADLTIAGFIASYGRWVSIFTAVALICFAFSTTIGWGLYGSRCVEFLFGTRVIRPFMVVYALVSIIGATLDLGLLWDISDTFNGLMVIPNLIAVFLLSGTVFRLTRDYFNDVDAGRLPEDP